MVGVDCPEEVTPVIQAGASEVYCGLRTAQGCLNVYSQVPRANLSSFDELESVARICRSFGVPLYLARNLRKLNTVQVRHSVKEIEHALELGIDGVIVADLQLLAELVAREFPLKIICSSLMPVFNCASVGFFKELGVTRIILPKQVSLCETRQLVISHPDIEFEVFIFFQGCHHVDPFCRTDHEKYRIGPNATQITIGRIVTNGVAEDSRKFPKAGVFTCQSAACGVCGLSLLCDLRDLSLKIASRGKSTERKIQATRLVAQVLSTLTSRRLDQQTTINIAKTAFRSTHGYDCDSYYCYCEGSWKGDIFCRQG